MLSFVKSIMTTPENASLLWSTSLLFEHTSKVKVTSNPGYNSTSKPWVQQYKQKNGSHNQGNIFGLVWFSAERNYYNRNFTCSRLRTTARSSLTAIHGCDDGDKKLHDHKSQKWSIQSSTPARILRTLLPMLPVDTMIVIVSIQTLAIIVVSKSENEH